VASSSIVSWIFSLITRPPQVDYELTPLGRTLLDAAQALLA
jgi:DNA-binding HxlR family transcriptional regulator